MRTRARGIAFIAAAMSLALSAGVSCNAILGIDQGTFVPNTPQYKVRATRSVVRLPHGGATTVRFVVDVGEVKTIAVGELPDGVRLVQQALAADGKSAEVQLAANEDGPNADTRLSIDFTGEGGRDTINLALRIAPPGTLEPLGKNDPIFKSQTTPVVRSRDNLIYAIANANQLATGELTILRLKDDGTPDPSFGTDGALVLPHNKDESCAAIQAVFEGDTLVVLGGCKVNGSNLAYASWIWQVPLVKEGGEVTTTLNGAFTNEFIFGAGRYPNGKLWIGSHVHTGHGTFFRSLQNDELGGDDATTFRATAPVEAGHVFFAADYRDELDATVISLNRFTPELVYDPTYGIDGAAVFDAGTDAKLFDGSGPTTAVLQPAGTGTLLLLVSAEDPFGVPAQIAKLNADGFLDPSFPTGRRIMAPTDDGGRSATAIEVTSGRDGRDRILLARRFGTVRLERSNVEGKLDPTFGKDGRGVVDLDKECDASSIVRDEDGLLLVPCATPDKTEPGKTWLFRVWP
jgi:hypothetical protein